VPRFEAALAGAGYYVTVEDRRPCAPGTRVDTELLRDSVWVDGDMLRAVAREPLGQVEFDDLDDMVWRAALLCAVFPEARTLFAVDCPFMATLLYNRLAPEPGLDLRYVDRQPTNLCGRCLVTTPSWLPRLKPGHMDVVVLVVFQTQSVSEATYRAVARLRARRVYALRSSRLRLGWRTEPRLEAMSGPVTGPPGGPFGHDDAR
jgi:hypothetical protein